MHAKSFNISVQGASHIKKNKECQDASRSYYDDEIAIAVVCDGHGGNDYVRSAVGSSVAAAIAERNIKDFVSSVDKDELKRHSDQLLAKLEGSIIGNWNEEIYQHYEQNPFTEEEIAVLSSKAQKKYLQEKRIESAYGTTLIAVVVTPDYWFGIHIGDGKCVAISPDGRFLQPIPWDDKCFLNATTSICDTRALENFRHFYSEKLPVAVFVGSDGIDDCFKNDQQLNNLYKTVLYSFTTSEFDSAVSDLHDYLPRLSAKGSGDDVSVAAVLDMDMIGEIDAVKAFDREKEKARIEENARIEAEKAEAERKRVEAERARQKEEAEAKRKAEAAKGSIPRSRIKPAPDRICRNCGTPLLPGVKFCSECGSKVEREAEQEERKDSPDTVTIVKVIPFKTEAEAESKESDSAGESIASHDDGSCPDVGFVAVLDDSTADKTSVPEEGEIVAEQNDSSEPAIFEGSEVRETVELSDQATEKDVEPTKQTDASNADCDVDGVDLTPADSDDTEAAANDRV